MESSTLREKLHSFIETSSEEKLMEVYSIFEDNYSEEFKKILDEEYADYQRDEKVESKEEMDKVIEKLLYGK